MNHPPLQPGKDPHCQYRFGEFLLDLTGGFLHRNGEEVALPPKPFEVLMYLAKHHGRLVSKVELIEAMWQDAAVTDNSLAQCVREVRQALGDRSQQMIRTVARRGYLFAVPVTISAMELPPSTSEHATVSRLDSLPRKDWSRFALMGAAILLLGAISVGLLLYRPRLTAPHELTYTQITNFTDSAVAPALSPDGRMVAFFRSDEPFHTPDPVYVKMLPHGEPLLLSDDSRLKYGLSFSPDGSQIAYTVLERGQPGWNSVTLSPLGGEPRLFMSNASGLTWLDARRFLFSEVSTGVHMGVVTARADRSELRKLYFPQHERSMVHLSYASPDRQWALILEMNPVWQPCRVISLDGSSAGRQVGPPGECRSAAWSPDGRWMYFGVEAGGEHHLWRQRFPRGEPEQITFGPTVEDGIAVLPDGRSLITSIGMQKSAVWIHDRLGARPLTSEGSVAPMRVFPYSSVRFSPDGKSLYYLLKRDSSSAPSELWRTNLRSETGEPALPGVSMLDYDISSDGREVIFSAQRPEEGAEIWWASLDRRAPPRRIPAVEGAWPHFGPDGDVLFQWSDGKANYLVRVRKDGSNREKVFPEPIANIYAVSPDRRWIVLGRLLPDSSSRPLIAVPVEGGAVRTICENPCHAAWAPDGRLLYVEIEPSSLVSPGKTLVIPIPLGDILPKLPAGGVRSLEEGMAIPGTRVEEGASITPGPGGSVSVRVKTTMHRNLFQIPLRGGSW